MIANQQTIFSALNHMILRPVIILISHFSEFQRSMHNHGHGRRRIISNASSRVDGTFKVLLFVNSCFSVSAHGQDWMPIFDNFVIIFCGLIRGTNLQSLKLFLLLNRILIILILAHKACRRELKSSHIDNFLSFLSFLLTSCFPPAMLLRLFFLVGNYQNFATRMVLRLLLLILVFIVTWVIFRLNCLMQTGTFFFNFFALFNWNFPEHTFFE